MEMPIVAFLFVRAHPVMIFGSCSKQLLHVFYVTEVRASARGARRRRLNLQAAIVAAGGAVPATRGVSFRCVLHFFELGHSGFLIKLVNCAHPIYSVFVSFMTVEV